MIVVGIQSFRDLHKTAKKLFLLDCLIMHLLFGCPWLSLFQSVVVSVLCGTQHIDVSVVQVHGIVSPQLLAPFTQSELELLLSGLPAIDIADWRQHCEYRGCSADTSECEWYVLYVPSRMLTRMAVQVLGHR